MVILSEKTTKIFYPGEGTITITLLPNDEAKDFKGGYYKKINAFHWIGPRMKMYYELDSNDKVIDPAYSNDSNE